MVGVAFHRSRARVAEGLADEIEWSAALDGNGRKTVAQAAETDISETCEGLELEPGLVQPDNGFAFVLAGEDELPMGGLPLEGGARLIAERDQPGAIQGGPHWSLLAVT